MYEALDTRVIPPVAPREQFYRQGDIFFVPLTVERTPWRLRPGNGTGITDALLEKNAVKGGIIARGETTGHMHKIDPVDQGRRSAILGTVVGLVGMVMRVFSPTKVVHEEHGTVTLPPGDYLVRNQREFDPLTRQRYVVD